MIKWIISDMDGTLLDDCGNLPHDFDEIIMELKKRNIIFSPASGRQHDALVHQFSKYKDDWLFIAENGTMVSKGDKLLSSSSLPAELTDSLIAAATSLPGVYTVVCTCQGSYIVDEYQPFIDEMAKYYTRHQLIDDFSQITDPIIKISVCDCDNNKAINTAYNQLEKYKTDVQVVMASAVWVDIMPQNINKGIAIQKIQSMLDIKPEECMAFGDFYNDCEMLKAVGESYAMDNAVDEVKSIAKYIAPSNNQHGVTKTIKAYLQNTYKGDA